MASGGRDCSVRLWNIDTDATIIVFSGLKLILDVLCVEFDREGHTLAVAGMDNRIAIWNLNKDDIKELINLSNSYSKNDQTNFPTLRLYDPDFVNESVHRNYIDGLVWFGKNAYITKSCDGDIAFWRIVELGTKVEDENEQLKMNLKPATYWSTKVKHCSSWFIRVNFDRNSKCLALGDFLGQINMFDLDVKNLNEIKKAVIQSKSSKSAIRNTTFSNDGKILIACNELGEILRFNKVGTVPTID